MKTATYGIAGLAATMLIVACVAFEDRIGSATDPKLAAIAVDAGCTGGPEFLETAIAGLDPTLASAVAAGVRTACTLRANRKTISATVYDDPVTDFCAGTMPLAQTEADFATRSAFNQRRAELCEGRP